MLGEPGGDDERVALDTWAMNCLGADGELEKAADIEATEKAWECLQTHGVVEDMSPDQAGFKFMTTRWENGWRMNHGDWKIKVRFVAREYKWAERREDMFSVEATRSAGRGVDLIALKWRLETYETDAVNAYYQAPKFENVIVEPAAEHTARLEASGRATNIV